MFKRLEITILKLEIRNYVTPLSDNIRNVRFLNCELFFVFVFCHPLEEGDPVY